MSKVTFVKANPGCNFFGYVPRVAITGIVLAGIYSLFNSLKARPSSAVLLSDAARSLKERGIEEKLVNLVEKVSRCPSAKSLWDDVYAKGAIDLQFTTMSRSSWDYQARTIRIARNLASSDYRLSSLLFELCNANSNAEDLFMDEKIKLGLVSQEGFLKKMVFHEYESALCHHKIAATCQKSSSWDPKIDKKYGSYFIGKNPPWRTAETAFEHIKKQFSTSQGWTNWKNYQIQNWNILGKAAYCSKNPQAPEC